MRTTSMAASAAIGAAALLIATSAPAGATITANTPAGYTPQTNGRVADIAYDQGRDIAYVVGDFTQVRNASGGGAVVRNRAAAFRISTGALLAWNPNLNGPARAVQFHPGFAHVYIGGNFTTSQGVARNRVVDVDPNSGAPRAWSPMVPADVKTIALAPNNSTLYVGGVFHSVRGQGGVSVTRNLAAAFSTANGSTTAWDPEIFQVTPYGSTPQADGDPCPPTCFPTVSTLQVTGDGSKVYIGGTFAFVGGDGNKAGFTGARRHSAAAVDAGTGRSVTGFDPDVYLSATTKGSQNSVYEIVLFGGKAFLCGDFFRVGGQTRTNIAAVSPTTGALVAGFVTSTDGAVNACAAAGSTLYIGGHFQKVGGSSQGIGGAVRNHVAGVNVNSGATIAWSPFVNSIPGVYAIRTTSKVLGIGGDFTTVAGAAHQGYAQWNGTP